MRNPMLLAALCLGVAATSHADTTFILTGNSFTSGATATGTVNIDVVAGTIDSVNVVYDLDGVDSVFNGTPTTQGTFDKDTQYFEYSFDNAGDLLLIDIPGASLAGYAGNNLCSFANLCGDGYLGYFATSAGEADPLATGSLAQTPEPSSLVLLGSGMVGVAGAARRRFARVNH